MSRFNINTVMWWRRTQSDNEALRERINASEARVLEAQAKIAEVFTTFLTAMAEMSGKSAARTLGIRSGQVRRERKQQQRKSGCRLCADPMVDHLTVEEINLHRTHGTNGGQPVAAVNEDR